MVGAFCAVKVARSPVPPRQIRAHQSIRMKVAYLVAWDAYRPSGVLRKVASQVDSWRATGASVLPVLLSTQGSGEQPVFPSLGQPISAAPFDRAREASVWAMLSRSLSIGRVINLIGDFSPDVVYYRQGIWFPRLASVLRRQPYVLELNTSDVRENRTRDFARRLLHSSTRGFVFGRAAGYVCVSKELAEEYSADGTPTCVYANGYDYASAPTLGDGPTKAAIFVGTPGQPWHGIDRLERLAQVVPEKHFHVVGAEKSFQLPNVTWHGYLSGKPLADLYAQCDVGIGSLAIERAGISEASPLKTREYFAHGLSLLLGYRDTDFSEAPFALTFAPNVAVEGWPVSLLREFLLSPPRPTARTWHDWAQRSSWRGKANRLMEFLSQVAR